MAEGARRRLAASLLTLSLCASSLLSQQLVATGGRVLDAAGEPVVGATVTFAGTRPPLDDRFDAAHTVELQTDASGRFVARLRDQHEYMVWVAGPAADDGARDVSGVRQVLPGAGFEVTLRERRASSALVLRGLDAWREALGEVRVEVSLDTAQRAVFAPEIDDAGPARDGEARYRLPPRPIDTRWFLYVRDANGDLVEGVRLPEQEPFACSLPAPRRVRARVVDAEGRPIVGAGIRVQTGNTLKPALRETFPDVRRLDEWRPAGVTGEDGEAGVLVGLSGGAQRRGPPTMYLLAGKAGRLGSFGGWEFGMITDGRKPAPDQQRLERDLPEGPYPFTLRAGDAFHGRILGLAGEPVADVGLALEGKMSVPNGEVSTSTYPFSFRTRSEKDGTFRFDHVPSEVGDLQLTIGVPTGQPGSRWAPAMRVPDLGQALEVDLRTFPKLSLSAVDASGLPARSAHVFLMSVPVGARVLDAATHRVRLDNRGEAMIRVQPGRWQVCATDGVGFARRILTADGDEALRFELEELPELRGKLLWNEGTKPSDVRFWIGVTNRQWTEGETQLGLRAVEKTMNDWLIRNARVDEDGTFAMRLLPFAGASHSGGVTAPGGKTAKVEFAPTDEPIELDIRRD